MFIDFREKGRETGTSNGLPLVRTLTKDQIHNVGMRPDWGLNPQPFGVPEDAPTN